MADVDALWHVSSGRALRALSVHVDGHCDVVHWRVGKQMLLAPPEDVRSLGATQGGEAVAFSFLTSQEASSFRENVKEEGWSFSVGGELPAGQGGQMKASFESGGKDRTESSEKLEKKVSHAYVTQCLYVPVKSFQIPKHKMVLCKDALADARRVHDTSSAGAFLRRYGSHACIGVYHVGGIFFREHKLSSDEEMSLRKLVQTASRNQKWSFGVSLPGVAGGEVSGGSNTSDESLSETSSSCKVTVSEETVRVLGPSAAKDENEFRTQLQAGHPLTSWAVIDVGNLGQSADNMVSVWEIILLQLAQHSSAITGQDQELLRAAARFMGEWWNQEASTFSSSSPVLSALLLHNRRLLEGELIKPVPAAPQDHFTIPSLPQTVTLTELPKRLQDLLGDHHEPSFGDDDSDVAPAVVPLLKSCISWFDNQSQAQIITSKHQFRDIILEYGFDEKGNMLADSLKPPQLRSMIEDIGHLLEQGRFPPTLIPEPARATWDVSFNPELCSEEGISHRSFRYMGDLVLDRSLSHVHQEAGPQSQKNQQACLLLDCLRHSIDPLEFLAGHGSGAENAGDASDSSGGDDECSSSEKGDQKSSTAPVQNPFAENWPVVSPFELLIHLLGRSDLVVQVAIFKLLLEQRAAAPLVFHPGTASGLALTHFTQALSFVKVKVANEEKVSITEDIELPRVVFLSNRAVTDSGAALVASRALNCNFMSQHVREDMGRLNPPVLEVGIGFLKSSRLGQPGSTAPLTCLAFHVEGPYQKLVEFVDKVADVVVLEVEPGSTNHSTSPPSGLFDQPDGILKWEASLKNKRARSKNMIWGSESYVVSEIEKFLISKLQAPAKQARQRPEDGNTSKRRLPLRDACVDLFQLPAHRLMAFDAQEESLGKCDFTTVKQSLTLQKSFAREAGHHFEMLQVKDNPGQTQMLRKKCDNEKMNRRSLAAGVIRNPMLQLFHGLLSQTGATSRTMGMLWVQRAISTRMQPLLEAASSKVEVLFHEYQMDPSRSHLKYLEAKQEYVDKVLGVDNLWRELSHIFVAAPTEQIKLATLAATHLMDGFPMEILDGDSGLFCEDWVKTVLVELEALMQQVLKHPARLLVLSAMGLQSSGKSTVLNLMFGTQLQTSAGRCTRGVYMQLVPSERAEYDFVVLLDTEGLRSPEYHGLKDSNSRDNRLATLGLLPADASIFMVSNEDDTGLKEVLPMVMLAFKGSEMAEQCGGRMRTKMAFVYRSVDTNDKKKLKENKQKLQEYLRQAAEQVARMRHTKEGSEARDEGSVTTFQTFFDKDFHVDDDEEQSDAKCMGNLKRGHNPPDDVPEWAYGKQVVNLREYIHKRVVTAGWKATSVRQWSEHLSTVWQCICTADFDLSFKTALEVSAYRELQDRLAAGPRRALSKRYMEEFESLEDKVRSVKEEDAFNFRDVLFKNVGEAVESTTQEVKALLRDRDIWKQWQVQENAKWDLFRTSLKENYRRRIDDLISGVLSFEKVVRDYEQKMKKEIVEIVEKMEKAGAHLADSDDHNAQSKLAAAFDDIFERILAEAQTSHEPFAQMVPRAVRRCYEQNYDLARRFDLFSPVKTSGGVLSQFTSMGWRGRRGYADLEEHLRKIMDSQLRDVKKYSDFVVGSVIRATVALLDKNDKWSSRDGQEHGHRWVMKYLTDRLQVIQKDWDKKHNIAEQLEGSKPRLKTFFAARASMVGAANRLISELQSLLEEHMQEAHCELLVKEAAMALDDEPWVKNWGTMLTCLDLHLLNLMDRKRTEDLLSLVSDGRQLYELVADALMGDRITGLYQPEWKRFFHKVQNCLKEAAAAHDPSFSNVVAQAPPPMITVDLFLDALSQKFCDTFGASSKVATQVVPNVYRKQYAGHSLDQDFYLEKLPQLCKTLQQKFGPADDDQCAALDKSTKKALIDRVRERMVLSHDEHCRPRCKEACPRCGMTCFLAEGHAYDRHDTVHQPRGLSGGSWVHTKCLEAESCGELVQEDALFCHDGKWTRYREFNTVYSGWATPSIHASRASLRIREFVFYTYQAALVARHPGTKPCEDMPHSYNHNFGLLSNQGRNSLGEKMFTDVTRILKSLV